MLSFVLAKKLRPTPKPPMSITKSKSTPRSLFSGDELRRRFAEGGFIQQSSPPRFACCVGVTNAIIRWCMMGCKRRLGSLLM